MASQAKDIASMLAEMPVAPADDVVKYTEVQIDGLVRISQAPEASNQSAVTQRIHSLLFLGCHFLSITDDANR
jgi:hypothetical protein